MLNQDRVGLIFHLKIAPEGREEKTEKELYMSKKK